MYVCVTVDYMSAVPTVARRGHWMYALELDLEADGRHHVSAGHETEQSALLDIETSLQTFTVFKITYLLGWHWCGGSLVLSHRSWGLSSGG